MTGHTKEPWCESISSAGTVEIYASGALVAEINADDEGAVNDAARIVDCVNALATIPDPQAFMEAARGMREALRPFAFAAKHAPKIEKKPHDFVLASEFDAALTAATTFDATLGEQ